MRGAQNYMKIIGLSYIMTQKNTINKVHVAAAELQQPVVQNTNILGEATAQKLLSYFMQTKVN